MHTGLDSLWVPLLVFASSGVGVVSSCAIPQDPNEVIKFTAVNNTNQYLVSCHDPTLHIYPLEASNGIRCDGTGWTASGSSVALKDLLCVNMCPEPSQDDLQYSIDEDYVLGNHGGRISKQSNGVFLYIPGVKIHLQCTHSADISSEYPDRICGDDGQWTPALSGCLGSETTAKSLEEGVSPDPTQTLIISITVIVVAVLTCTIVMVAIAVRAKWRGACRKRHAPTSHPDDINYPIGYTQLGSGSMLPSYAEATEDCDEVYREAHHMSGAYPVYRSTTTADYRQLSSLESSSRGESESLSAGSHRHSLFSGSSSNYRNVVGGDDISDILLQGDHLSMSDTSTLVTVNTYESNRTASNPSLTNSRRGVAGSMVSNTATSMDDAPLIVRRSDTDAGDDICASSNLDC